MTNVQNCFPKEYAQHMGTDYAGFSIRNGVDGRI